VIPLEQVIQVSSNIGASKIGDRLGKQRLYEYYRAFGFGESTRSGLRGEINGLLYNPRRWSRIALATHSFGQGMTVTGMQIASALAAIANGGSHIQTHTLLSTLNREGQESRKAERLDLGRVISPEAAAEALRIMTYVTKEGGTGTKAAIEGYTVAGKTGTAQKVDPVLKRYAPGLYTSSFIGAVPAENPRLVIVAIMDEPRGGQYYGGTVSGPVFAEVARATLRYLGVEPTVAPTPAPEGTTPRPNLVSKVTIQEGETGEAAALDADTPLIKPVAAAEGEPPEAYILPDFSGQTMRTVLSAVDDKMFSLEFVGSGIAVSQSPKAGDTVHAGDKLTVVFQPDGDPPEKKDKDKPPTRVATAQREVTP
jgi:cell division protein FtsI (penicillin-binding protein 3)